MAKTPSAMDQILDVVEEKDEALIETFKKNSQEGEAFICFIAPYVVVRISPSKYISASIGLSEEFGTETVIDKIREILEVTDPTEKISKVYLLLNSPGGLVHSSYKVAKALRKSFKEITVFVVHMAASGGTLIALAGNEIIMGTMSQLSPLDPSSNSISALSVVRSFQTVTSFLSTIQEGDIPYSYKSIANKFTAEKIDRAQSVLELMKKYASEILTESGYDDTATENISERLVEGCLDHSEVIDYDTAKDIGLKVSSNSKYIDLWGAFRDWLNEYLLAAADKHVIRYWVNHEKKKEKKSSEEKGKKENSK